MGTPLAAVPTLERLLTGGNEVVAVWTQPDRPAGRGNKLNVPPVKEFALKHSIPVHQPTKIKTDEAAALFAAHEADACVVVAYGRILPPAFLHSPREGCINVHFSLLPKYRGAAPVNWAIVRGESETGVTTMLMDEGLDTGAMLLQEHTAIGARETAPELTARLATMGAELLSRTLQNLSIIKPREQDHTLATLAPILKREDGRLDWSQPAAHIERMTRGFQSFPSAHTLHDGRRLIIAEAEVVDERVETVSGAVNEADQIVEPGEIVEASGKGLVVACGAQTRLRLVAVQPEGKRHMSARDWMNGARVVTGERLV